MKPLRIAMVAPLWASVPPATYGGTELMIHLLTEELVERGHEVTLFAAGGSHTRARLHSIGDSTVSEAMARGEAFEYIHYANALFAEVLRAANSFDVIHNHLGCSFIPFGSATATCLLTTPHTVLSVDDLWALQRHARAPLAAVSHYQAEVLPIERRRAVRVIHHGIDFDAYGFSPRHDGYLAFLGRMGPQKSPLDAIRIARRAGMPLVLAGKPQNAEEECYFARDVLPHVDGKNVVHVGAVNHRQKNELLGAAAALLFPIQGEEAFGLAMIEAMACGTPVIAMGLGSVPEVVAHKRTGFVCASLSEMIQAVAQVPGIDRRACRAHVAEHFSVQRMTDKYDAVYRQILEPEIPSPGGVTALR